MLVNRYLSDEKKNQTKWNVSTCLYITEKKSLSLYTTIEDSKKNPNWWFGFIQ